jgi:hypothetical protein
LAVDVTGVFGLDFDLFGDLWIFCALPVTSTRPA